MSSVGSHALTVPLISSWTLLTLNDIEKEVIIVTKGTTKLLEGKCLTFDLHHHSYMYTMSTIRRTLQIL